MPKTIISDTSCFIILSNIGELELLHKAYGSIATTPGIAAEYGGPLPEWVEIIAVKDKYRQQLLEMQIDKGASSAIVLALETPDCINYPGRYKREENRKSLRVNLYWYPGCNNQSKNKRHYSINKANTG